MSQVSNASLYAELLRNTNSLKNSPYDNCITVGLNQQLVSSFNNVAAKNFVIKSNDVRTQKSFNNIPRHFNLGS